VLSKKKRGGRSHNTGRGWQGPRGEEAKVIPKELGGKGRKPRGAHGRTLASEKAGPKGGKGSKCEKDLGREEK